MKLDINNANSNYVIRSYDDHSISVDDDTLTQSFIISSDQLIQNWSPNHFSELGMHDLELIADLDPEIIIIGTGKNLYFPEPSMTAPFMSNNIGFEVMDTHAACRCYRILESEGRKVAAGLILEK